MEATGWAAGAVGVALAAHTLLPQAWHRGMGRGVLRSGPPGRPAVAFTFDDGPDPEVTLRVAALLEGFGARGTFFVVAQRLAAYGWVARSLAERGHEVALHGLTHRHLWLMGPQATGRQLREGLDRLQQAVGARVRFYRPPWGHFNGTVVAAARRLGLQVVLWTCAPPDWRRGVRSEHLARAIISGLRPGAIIDLHDRGPLEERGALLEALPKALERARARGLLPVSLSRLLAEG